MRTFRPSKRELVKVKPQGPKLSRSQLMDRLLEQGYSFSHLAGRPDKELAALNRCIVGKQRPGPILPMGRAQPPRVFTHY